MKSSIYGSEWTVLRLKIMDRDGNKCTSCGSSEGPLIVHHKRPLSMGGTNDERNLYTLCNRCHSTAHAAINEMIKEYGQRGLEFHLDEKKYVEYMNEQ